MNFNNFGPNQAMIDSTINGFTPGEVFNDLIVTNLGFCFGSIERARVFAIEKKRTLSFVSKEILEIPEECIKRRDYQSIQLRELENESPYKIAPFEPEKSNWKDVVTNIWGNLENYHQYGDGIGIFDGKVQIAESMLGYRGNSNWEIGTITHADYRGKGLSTLASYHLVKKLIDAGVRPSWSCNEDNPGSYRVAEKIGFENYQTYFLYLIRP